MEGGVNNSISLDAGIDTSTNDMLVPFSQATFAHNWQKYQGKYLANSLRFEKNGWAAGWNVYDFKYNLFIKQLTDNLYLRLNKYNTYAKQLALYSDSAATRLLMNIGLVSNNIIISGDANISADGVISGFFNNDESKPFSIKWDSDKKVATLETGDDLSLAYAIQDDYTVKLVLKDDSQSLNYNFGISKQGSLVSDSFSNKAISFINMQNGVYNWGMYAYDINKHIVTTAEGDSIEDIYIDQNGKIKFDYTHTFTQALGLKATFKDIYYSFLEVLPYDTISNKQFLLAQDAYTGLGFNHWYGATSLPNKLSTKNDIELYASFPVWFGFKSYLEVGIAPEVELVDVVTKCDNGTHNEVAVTLGNGILNKAKIINAFDTDTVKTVELTDNYRKAKSSGLYPQYLELEYRFNQILVANTIEAGANWSPYAVKISTGMRWFFNSKRYSNIRTKNTTLFRKYFGNVYTFGTFSFMPSEEFDYNNPWDWSSRDNLVYTKADISNVGSIKLIGHDNNTEDFSDTDFINSCLVDDCVLYLEKYVAKFNSTSKEFTPADTPFDVDSFDKLYNTNGEYIGGSFETVPAYMDEDSFWPFTKLPKFRFDFYTVDTDGTRHSDIRTCYYTDGTLEGTIFTQDDFKETVLGTYSSLVDPDNKYITENTKYSRSRLVKTYLPGYDFDFVTDTEAVTKFDDTWNAWYLGEFGSPLKLFNDSLSYGDNTYLDFEDIIIEDNIRPTVLYTTPGVYITSISDVDKAVLNNVFTSKVAEKANISFGNSAGAIPMKDNRLKTDAKINIYHAGIDKTNEYNIETYYEPGCLNGTYATGIDKATTDKLCSLYLYSGPNEPLSFDYSSGDTTNFKTSMWSAGYVPFAASKQAEYVSSEALILVNCNNDGEKIKGEGCWPYNFIISYYKSDISCKSFTHETKNIVDGISSWSVTTCAGAYSKVEGNTFTFAQAVSGGLAAKLSYNILADDTNIGDAGTFSCTSLPLDARKESGLYIDIEDTKFPKSILLAELNSASILPLGNTAGIGKDPAGYCIDINYTWKHSLYYATTDQSAARVFLPGFLTEDNTSINLTSTTMPNIYFSWVPYKVKTLQTLTLPTNLTNTLTSAHKLYDALPNTLSSFYFEVLDMEETADKPTQTVRLWNKTLQNPLRSLTYDLGTYSLELEQSVELYRSDFGGISILRGEYANEANVFKTDAEICLIFKDVEASICHLNVTSGYTLASIENNVASINAQEGHVLYYNLLADKVISPSGEVSITQEGIYTKVQLVSTVTQSILAALVGVWEGSIDGNFVTFKFNDSEYTVDITELSTSSNYVDVLSTNVTIPDKTLSIGKLNAEEYQLVKQQWNSTSEVENFWWVDNKHILELGMSKFTLKRKLNELDDWAGDKFEDVWDFPRGGLLTPDVLNYFVTNVYYTDTDALFVTLSLKDKGILVSIFDIQHKFMPVSKFSLNIKTHSIGEVLLSNIQEDADECNLDTYNSLSASSVISKARWSNTLIGDYFILGCHLSNNFDQWAVVYNTKEKKLVNYVQGYGFVGLDGSLTGGMLPVKYFTNGFNSIVQDVSVLSKQTGINSVDEYTNIENIDDLYKLNSCVVGTAEQQWYIDTEIKDIVSHLLFNKTNGSFSVEILPITNNFETIYKSPSFYSSVCGDAMIQASAFANMFTFGDSIAAVKVLFNAVMTLCGWPMLFIISPRLANIVYLQQSLGQYAYVHYNSSNTTKQRDVTKESTRDKASLVSDKDTPNSNVSGLSSADIIFDRQRVIQREGLHTSTWGEDGETLLMLLTSIALGVDTLQTNLSVNEAQAQRAMSDIGRKYSDNALTNAEDMIIGSIVSRSDKDIGLTSIVSGSKSLDMFYSTSDAQNIFAGPGFVEHQFVADCVAQSTTDIQLEGSVTSMFWLLKNLSTYQLDLAIKLLDAAEDALQAQVDALGGGTWTSAAAVALALVLGATKATNAVTKAAKPVIEGMLSTLAGQGVSIHRSASVSKHALTTEAKHKYGEKNEIFMWPCFGVDQPLSYTDETVQGGVKAVSWQLSLCARNYYLEQAFNANSPVLAVGRPKFSSNRATKQAMMRLCGWGNGTYRYKSGEADLDTVGGDNLRAYYMLGAVPYYQAAAYGKTVRRMLPANMSKIEGVRNFLPAEVFKNENIDCSSPAFVPSMQQDYILDKSWELSQYCTYGLQQWVAVKDTKVIDCPHSNIYIGSTFCGIASPYTAVEVKRGLSKEYMRPYAITPNTLALNCTGYNAVFENKLYHAFDGTSYRIVDLVGSPGLGKNRQSFWYAFQLNDRLKRSNKLPAVELQGNFESEPVQAISSIDSQWSTMTVANKEVGLEAGAIGEDKDLIRWAIPVFTEQVSTLPAAVKTLTVMQLGVVEGVTSLCTDLANNQSAYKAPLSIDFTINKLNYRVTQEYICSITTENGIDVVTEVYPILGLTYIGSSTTVAYFYSKATRCYYVFTGNALTKQAMIERFRDVQRGYWDFVNQEVVMPCLMTFKRLNPDISDKDSETDNIMVPIFDGSGTSGELPPPITTIFNDQSWYKCVSLPMGFTYQGPNRVIINRNVFIEYMLKSFKQNLGKWKKLDREKYSVARVYPETFNSVVTDIKGIDGWVYNPFILVTSALGTNEGTDCLFEWSITFCWTIEMDLIYSINNYAVVNVMSETMTTGGKVKSRPTHIYLTKELFTRTGNYGYYSFKYQGKNGAGNRERLYVWSDQYIAISSLTCESKQVTTKRTEILTQQLDIQGLKEL